MNSKSFPLTETHFGEHIRRLQSLIEKPGTRYKKAYFLHVLENLSPLEERLQRLQPSTLSEGILSEINNLDEPYNLDMRLLDAWAELRVADQLIKEGFQNIRKVVTTADFIATKDDKVYAVQVRRIRAKINVEIEKLNRKAAYSGEKIRKNYPYGRIEDISHNFEEPLSSFFWSALEEKNRKFARWDSQEITRCVVLVTNDPDLQDNLVRHIACQQLGKIIQGFATEQELHFEELVWLPDLSNGAWFNVSSFEYACDWQDEPLPYPRDYIKVDRRNVSLKAFIP